MKIEDTVITHFTASVKRYTEDLLHRDEFAMRAFKNYAERRLRVLELGCGTGHCLESLSLSYPRFDLYGLDITPAMVKTARKLRPDTIVLMVGDCLRTPFKNDKFDAVVMYSVLHHLVTKTKEESSALREAGLRELLRLLAPDGFIVLEEVCVNAAWRSALIFALSHLLSRSHISIPALHIHTNVVLNFFTLDELAATLDRLGLYVVKQEIKKFKGIGTWISTVGSFTYHVHYVLKRKE